jgi:hypothetical protein
MQKPKENRENIRVWVGGKKGQGRRRRKMQGRTAKDEEASNSHTYVLRASSTTTTPIAFILRNAHPDT